MRAGVAFFAAAACFNPHAPAGAPCAENGDCPAAYQCNAGVCTVDPAADPTVQVIRSGDGAGVVSAPGTTIDCGSSCEATVDVHSLLTLIATAEVSSRFVAWSGVDCAGPSCTIVVDDNVTVGAEFAIEPTPVGPMYTLTVMPSGSGTGTITSDVAGISCGGACAAMYTADTVVTLAASASAGSGFLGWSGGGCAGMGTCVLTMNQAQTVTAAFSKFFDVNRTNSGVDHDVTYPGYNPGGTNEGFAFRATSTSSTGLRPIYNCRVAGADAMLSGDAACEGVAIIGLVGYVFSASPGIAFYRCRTGTGEHFVSMSPNCEGTIVEFVLGYSR